MTLGHEIFSKIQRKQDAVYNDQNYTSLIISAAMRERKEKRMLEMRELLEKQNSL